MMDRFATRAAIVLILLVAALWPPGDALAEKRVALIIGNGAYQKVPQLTNPSNDAADVTAAFERLGFTVRKVNDATYDSMRRALIELGRDARDADMAVVYFSGHGIEIGGQNWLIPVDAELRADTDIENEAIGLSAVMLQVSTATKLGLVILDACRNNPFASKMAFSTRTRAVARGLARIEPNENVLIAYAAKDGTTANDGDGRNSPFTDALLKNIEQPGLEITFMFRNVRDAVMASTKRQQQPFVYGSLSKEAIYLKDPPAPGPAAPAAAVQEPDEALWAVIRESKVPGLFEEFLRRFPKSPRAAEARSRLDESQKLALASPPPGAPGIARAGMPPSPEEPQADGMLTVQDINRIAAAIKRNELIMPQYRIARPDNRVPEHLRRFVGVWASRIGFGGGQGRQVTLIITDVEPDGQVRGYYGYGPQTPGSTPGPARTYDIAGKIVKDELTFELPGSNNSVKLAAGGALVLHSYLKRYKRTPMVMLEPLWRLSERERLAKP